MIPKNTSLLDLYFCFGKSLWSYGGSQVSQILLHYIVLYPVASQIWWKRGVSGLNGLEIIRRFLRWDKITLLGSHILSHWLDGQRKRR